MRNYKKRINFSITKYNPIYRNEYGHYQHDDWTSISDIGKTFEGIILTYDKYLEVENRYVDSVFCILDFFNVNKVKINHIYKFDKKSDFKDYNSIDLYSTYKIVNTNTVLNNRNQIDDLIRLRLREHIVELELVVSITDRIEILFGFDFYMYLKTNKDVSVLIDKISKLGLFVN
jgi:hypothetical protein